MAPEIGGNGKRGWNGTNRMAKIKIVYPTKSRGKNGPIANYAGRNFPGQLRASEKAEEVREGGWEDSGISCLP